MSIDALIDKAIQEVATEKEAEIEAKINELIIQLLSYIIEDINPDNLASLVDKSVENFIDIQEDFLKDNEIFVKMVMFSGESIKKALGVDSVEEDSFLATGTIQ